MSQLHDKPKVRYLLCGGTIFSEATPEGLKPVTSGQELFGRYFSLLYDRVHVETAEILRLDSTDMHYAEYRKLGESMVEAERNGYVPVDVQGTDSMVYGAAFLTVRIPFKRLPYIVTGSMHPVGADNSDALRNVLAAATVATHSSEFPGTYLCVNSGQIHRASRSVKLRPNKPARRNGRTSTIPEERSFESVNYPVLAGLENDRLAYKKGWKKKQLRFLERQRRRDEYFRPLFGEFGYPLFLPHYADVAVIDLHANFKPELLDEVYNGRYKAVLIKAPGTGGIPNNPKNMALLPKMKRWTSSGRFVVVAPKITHAIADQTYEVNRRSAEAGAVLTYDMHADFALAKAELAAALASSPEDFRALMYYSFEDEINEDLLPDEQRVADEKIYKILSDALRRKENGGWLGWLQRFSKP